MIIVVNLIRIIKILQKKETDVMFRWIHPTLLINSLTFFVCMNLRIYVNSFFTVIFGALVIFNPNNNS